MPRTRIAVITVEPQGFTQHLILKGVIQQCRKYGYDTAVYAQNVKVIHKNPEDLEGERSIYDMICFEAFQGVIVDALSFYDTSAMETYAFLAKLLRERCHCPVITLNHEMEGYPVLFTDSSIAIKRTTEHLIERHDCRRLLCLTGSEADPIAAQRAEGFRRAMRKHGLPCKEEQIIYGDFWYTSGETLAERILHGEFSDVQGVVCASDYMALGLIRRLTQHGIRVGQDILVTGYDDMPEGAVNQPSLTSYVPDEAYTAAQAVQYLHDRIEVQPETEAITHEDGLICCASCGCSEDGDYLRKRLCDLLIDHSILQETEFTTDFNSLHFSFMQEALSLSTDPADCLSRLTHYTYLLEPYREFWLCLNENWVTMPEETGVSDTTRLQTVLHAVSDREPPERKTLEFNDLGGRQTFSCRSIPPVLEEPHDAPYVYYFTPVHFLQTVYGYGVLACSAADPIRPDIPQHNWYRMIDTAFKMTCVQYQLRVFSEYDAMTGMFNRRGMDRWLREALSGNTEHILVVSIDMDRLKYINDTFGHSEGDFGIREIAACIRGLANGNEICVRTGGDEFLLIGTGRYQVEEITERLQRFREEIVHTNMRVRKPYELSASVGFSIGGADDDLETLINTADEVMYRDKVSRRMRREDQS